MTQVSFYHLLSTSLEKALPQLLEKTLQAGKRALVLSDTEERIKFLNTSLWEYDPASFLPHGSAEDGNPAHQPIWLSTNSDENPNQAEFLFLLDAAACPDFLGYERVIKIFDGRNEAAVTAARKDWKAWKEQECELQYFKQQDSGAWEKIAA